MVDYIQNQKVVIFYNSEVVDRVCTVENISTNENGNLVGYVIFSGKEIFVEKMMGQWYGTYTP